MRMLFIKAGFLSVVFLFVGLFAFSQQRLIHGIVISEANKEPLQSASVTVEGSRRATMTDEKGQFSIGANAGETLIFSVIGFAIRKLVLQGETQLSVSVRPNHRALETVVVTALGIRKTERSLGYALAKVDSTQLTDAISSNWMDALSGKVAGLQMIRSGSGPAGSNKIILRGENNLTGDNEALIVLDGVVISNGSGRRSANGSDQVYATNSDNLPGIPFRINDSTVQFRTREQDDIINMGSSAQEFLITGFQSDPKGGDGGYEYVQMLATKNLNFVTTPYSIVFCNNAGTASSANPLDAGWATGGQRTIKWNITSGSVLKGQFFYFGFQGKKINGSAGTYSFPPATNWYQKTYATTGTNPNLGDGGLVRASAYSTSGPWANSGNACGVAIFKGTAVTEATTPEDVLFVAPGGGAAIYDQAKNPVLGYRICNNDWYSMFSVVIDPVTYKPVVTPYLHYRSAGNTTNMPYPVNDKYPAAATDAGLFNRMGGVYNISLGRWTTARKQVVVELVQSVATIDSLEKHPSVTKLVE